MENGNRSNTDSGDRPTHSTRNAQHITHYDICLKCQQFYHLFLFEIQEGLDAEQNNRSCLICIVIRQSRNAKLLFAWLKKTKLMKHKYVCQHQVDSSS